MKTATLSKSKSLSLRNELVGLVSEGRTGDRQFAEERLRELLSDARFEGDWRAEHQVRLAMRHAGF